MSAHPVASDICLKYLRLHLCYGIGAIRFGALLREVGDIDRILGASVVELSRVEHVGHKTAERVARDRDEADVAGETALASERGVRILCLADAEYPTSLRMMDDPPPCLYVRGTLQREDAVAMAIVGSRHASHYGSEQAERFGALLAEAGLTIVSGMARGVDTGAHRGALSAGGRTLAVLGCGLCHLYPPESGDIAKRITESGALISELPMNVAPDAKNFPPRNRIIAGLSLGVLVVEAARRSGALITARLAGEYNREVFAIPGRIDVLSSEGCHDLIRTGAAKLVTRLEDILEELGETGAALMTPTGEMSDVAAASEAREPSLPFDDPVPIEPAPRPRLSAPEAQTLELLGSEAMPIESLCEAGELPPAQIAAALTGLQLKGLVRRVKGDLFERTKARR